MIGITLHFQTFRHHKGLESKFHGLPAGALSILIQKSSFQGLQQTAIQLKENH